MSGEIYSVGYSAYGKPEELIAALKGKGVKVLADIRTSPFSAIYPQYNRENIKNICTENGILYRYFGNELGARREDRSFLTDGQVDFEKIAKTKSFRDAIVKIIEYAEKDKKPCLFCAEKDPITCHRSILVGRYLAMAGHETNHLVNGCSVEKQSDLEDRLVDKWFKDRDQLSMFGDREMCELILDAYRKQNREIGYKPKD